MEISYRCPDDDFDTIAIHATDQEYCPPTGLLGYVGRKITNKIRRMT